MQWRESAEMEAPIADYFRAIGDAADIVEEQRFDVNVFGRAGHLSFAEVMSKGDCGSSGQRVQADGGRDDRLRPVGRAGEIGGRGNFAPFHLEKEEGAGRFASGRVGLG